MSTYELSYYAPVGQHGTVGVFAGRALSAAVKHLKGKQHSDLLMIEATEYRGHKSTGKHVIYKMTTAYLNYVKTYRGYAFDCARNADAYIEAATCCLQTGKAVRFTFLV